MEKTDMTNSEEIISEEKLSHRSHESLFGFFVMFGTAMFLIVLAAYGGWLLYHTVKENSLDMSRASIEMLPIGATTSEQQEDSKKIEEQKEEKNEVVLPDALVGNKKIAIKVMNGGAAKGMASVVAGVLMGSGYSMVSTGNTAGDYTGVTVYFKSPVTEADATAVKDVLLKKYPSSVTRSAISGNADTTNSPITVIVGK